MTVMSPQLAPPTPAEQELSFSRLKPRWWALSIAYRVVGLMRLAIGHERVLRLMLNLHWITWRMAYELTYTFFGGGFVNDTYGVSASVLARYVPSGGTVIDIGCGAGRLAHLIQPGTRFLGLDRDVDRIAQAQQAFAANPLVAFRCHDLTSKWPADAVGDVVLLVGVLERVDDPDALLQRLHQVASTLIVEVPDLDASPLNWARRRMNCPWYSDADHVREYTVELLESQLTRNGWVPVEWVQRGAMVLAVCRASGIAH